MKPNYPWALASKDFTTCHRKEMTETSEATNFNTQPRRLRFPTGVRWLIGSVATGIASAIFQCLLQQPTNAASIVLACAMTKGFKEGSNITWRVTFNEEEQTMTIERGGRVIRYRNAIISATNISVTGRTGLSATTQINRLTGEISEIIMGSLVVGGKCTIDTSVNERVF